MDDAIKDFAAILEIEPTNKSAYHQLQASKAKKKELIQLDKAIFGGMFQRFADFDTKVSRRYSRYNMIQCIIYTSIT